MKEFTFLNKALTIVITDLMHEGVSADHIKYMLGDLIQNAVNRVKDEAAGQQP